MASWYVGGFSSTRAGFLLLFLIHDLELGAAGGAVMAGAGAIVARAGGAAVMTWVLALVVGIVTVWDMFTAGLGAAAVLVAFLVLGR